jgi:hypothetical protein
MRFFKFLLLPTLFLCLITFAFNIKADPKNPAAGPRVTHKSLGIKELTDSPGPAKMKQHSPSASKKKMAMQKKLKKSAPKSAKISGKKIKKAPHKTRKVAIGKAETKKKVERQFRHKKGHKFVGAQPSNMKAMRHKLKRVAMSHPQHRAT